MEDWHTALVVGTFAILAQITTAILSWLQSRKNHSQLKQVRDAQIENKHELNGRLTELIDAVRAAAHSAGRLEGIEEQKRRALEGDTGSIKIK